MTDHGDSAFVHPAAICESDDVGRGTRVWAFAHVLPGARVGAECNICDHVFVEGGVRIGDRVTVKNGVLLFDGVTLEDDVFVGPGAVFTNDRLPRREFPKTPVQFERTVVRAGATVGAGAVVRCGVEVGSYAVVAAGAVVTRAVPPHALVQGNPARFARWVCRCGDHLDDALVCVACGCSYVVDGERGGLRPQAAYPGDT